MCGHIARLHYIVVLALCIGFAPWSILWSGSHSGRAHRARRPQGSGCGGDGRRHDGGQRSRRTICHLSVQCTQLAAGIRRGGPLRFGCADMHPRLGPLSYSAARYWPERTVPLFVASRAMAHIYGRILRSGFGLLLAQLYSAVHDRDNALLGRRYVVDYGNCGPGHGSRQRCGR